jgi:hypothetical protein
MTVYCQAETVAMPTEDDMERYIIVTDANGAVSSVVFNRNAECPTADVFATDKTCSFFGQQCSFETDSSYSDLFCTTTHHCTCEFGSFECGKASQSCIARSPPIINACPSLEQYQSGVYPECPLLDSCKYAYKSNDGAVHCDHEAIAKCVDGEPVWALSEACVPREAPSVAICPTLVEYQAGKMECAPVKGETCDYEYHGSSSSDDTAICEHKDKCSCVDNALSCDLSIECVSVDPPSFLAPSP